MGAMRVTGYAITALGSRKENQDSYMVDNDRSLFAVADGIGGGERGDVASLMAVTGVGAHPMDEQGARLRDTVDTIQEAVLREAMESLGEARMGTTLTCIRIQGNEGELVHVGDSRCYKFADGHLVLLTTDHESYDESYGGPVLSSYLGIPTDLFPFQVQEEAVPLKAGDRLLLCSDGLYKQVPENDLVATIQKHYTAPDAMLKALVAQAVTAEHSDNVTIVYIEFED
jgi:PPM family protein phosphatase